MGFTVQDMLDMKLFQKANLLWGKGGIGQEIRGVTIIESPDIVRFISGGEVLLTGLNAFQNCSPEEFRSYIAELAKKKVSALVIKQGRTVDFMEEKMAVIQEYAQRQKLLSLRFRLKCHFEKFLIRSWSIFSVRKLSDLSILRQLMIISRHCHFPFIPWKMECSVL